MEGKRTVRFGCRTTTILLCIFTTVTVQTQALKTNLTIMGFFPNSEAGFDGSEGSGVPAAVELALQDINDNNNVLADYNLVMLWNGTKCDPAIGTKVFFDAMYQLPPKLMLYGGTCSSVTSLISMSAPYWDLTQLSYDVTSPEFSDRKKYPTFFRTVPSDLDFNPARLRLLRHFNWTRVATLYQDEPNLAIVHSQLESSLVKAGMNFTAQGFVDVESARLRMKQIKDSDARIILGLFDETMARHVFCEAYKLNLYGKRYAWVLNGPYSRGWWNASADCTRDQMRTAVEGALVSNFLERSSSNHRTISGKTPAEYERQYHERVSGRRTENRFHGYAYDGVWVIALALDKVLRQLQQEGNVPRVKLTYERQEDMKMFMFDAVKETDFQGVTGKVRFRDGDRLGTILYEQIQEGSEVRVGEYFAENDSIALHNVQWQGDNPPRDKTLRVEELRRVPLALYLMISVMAMLGVFMAIVFLFFNIKYRNQRFVKMSSPYLNTLIIVGCILIYLFVCLLGLDGALISETTFEVLCTVRTWMLTVGFTLAFGAMFSKTWRVHVIFTNTKMKKMAIKDVKLFGIVAVLLLMDIVILTTWQVVDPLTRGLQTFPAEPGREVTVVPVLEHCDSNNFTLWLAVIFVYKGLLLIFGCFLAWETRHVNIPALNDSKYIGMSVYNVVIMCVIGAGISFVIKDRQNEAFVLTSLFIILCTTITLCLVFVPKLVTMRNMAAEERTKFKCMLTRRSGSKGTDSDKQMSAAEKTRRLLIENYKLKKTLQDKAEQLDSLMRQLQVDSDIDADAETTCSYVRDTCQDSPRSPSMSGSLLIVPDGRKHKSGSLASSYSASSAELDASDMKTSSTQSSVSFNLPPSLSGSNLGNETSQDIKMHRKCNGTRLDPAEQNKTVVRKQILITMVTNV
ncbi:PREDICTED: gamma-aminobutyric acid type B receptor subunit 2-like [Branchiostoma belcheri]|uniref:Gamma-aminobutyric acid type B receptor subunit 2 n=1 Tax=Branchiostoma belcheri TaxID=7741 RepID=A0A6P4XNG3_BRABE|nr:PREDICTED: gamma-aminobutyric acid type B receptor subunit 2-like [Branchiostoma belcheri]